MNARRGRVRFVRERAEYLTTEEPLYPMIERLHDAQVSGELDAVLRERTFADFGGA